MFKVILLLLIISSTLIDARALRKRRQLSSSSYYISNVNPYSNSYNPSTALTYPSGSFYTAPSLGYGYPNQGYSGDLPYDPNSLTVGIGQYNPSYSNSYSGQYGGYNPNNIYQFPSLGSTYGSGFYSSPLYGYALNGFNNQYANWNQGNNNQYYTGGTGNGLSSTGFYWYRKSGKVPFQGRPGENIEPIGNMPPERGLNN